jgi:polyisoprenoid-binding protein YceI
MTTRYAFDPRQSRFTAQAFATGFLSALGHDPIFTVAEFQGGMVFEAEGLQALELTVDSRALVLLSDVKPSDRQEIEGRMRRDVLETAAFPVITFQAERIEAHPLAPGRDRVRIEGRLSLHGVVNRHRIEAELRVLDGSVRLLGEFALRMSDFRIKPVSALAGAIKLKDEVRLKFDLLGLKEAS